MHKFKWSEHQPDHQMIAKLHMAIGWLCIALCCVVTTLPKSKNTENLSKCYAISGAIFFFARVCIDNGARAALMLWIPLHFFFFEKDERVIHVSIVYRTTYTSYGNLCLCSAVFSLHGNLEFLKIFYLFMLIFIARRFCVFDSIGVCTNFYFFFRA